MLVACGRKCVAAEYIQVRNVVRLAERIQHAFFRIDAHAQCASRAPGVSSAGIRISVNAGKAAKSSAEKNFGRKSRNRGGSSIFEDNLKHGAATTASTHR
jgi:hypothetical protein